MCKRIRVKEKEMQCLLQVVKWFTKCLFHSWLLKICIGLSLLFSSFVHDMFCKCSNFYPCGPQLSPHEWNTGSNGSSLCLEAKTGARTTKSDFFCLQIGTSMSSLILWKMSINVSLLQGNIQQKSVTFIQPYVSTSTVGEAVRNARVCHASVMLLSHHL